MTAAARHVDALIRALRSRGGASSDPSEALVEAWTTAWQVGRQAWPAFGDDPDGLAAWVVDLIADDEDPVAGLEALRVEDLYLAERCLRGDTAALATFESKYGGLLEGVARKSGAVDPKEVVQRLREKLLVGAEARLRKYGGRGPLGNWLAVACKRLTYDEVKSDQRRANRKTEHELTVQRIVVNDPEIALLKTEYRREFNEAFGDAMAELSPRARTMLRMHLVDQLSIDEIAPLYEIHRSTAFRWLEKAKQELLASTLASMRARLRVNDREVESIMNLIGSRLDVSLARHLQTRARPTTDGDD